MLKFKSSFSQSNVVLRGRFVICSGDLCVVDNAGRQAVVVERALFFRSAVIFRSCSYLFIDIN